MSDAEISTLGATRQALQHRRLFIRFEDAGAFALDSS